MYLSKELGVWVTSQFYDIDSDSPIHSKRILLQEVNDLNKNMILFVGKTKS
jgi:hypothetical protein